VESLAPLISAACVSPLTRSRPSRSGERRRPACSAQSSAVARSEPSSCRIVLPPRWAERYIASCYRRPRSIPMSGRPTRVPARATKSTCVSRAAGAEVVFDLGVVQCGGRVLAALASRPDRVRVEPKPVQLAPEGDSVVLIVYGTNKGASPSRGRIECQGGGAVLVGPHQKRNAGS
jgi:hypothetical protein